MRVWGKRLPEMKGRLCEECGEGEAQGFYNTKKLCNDCYNKARRKPAKTMPLA